MSEHTQKPQPPAGQYGSGQPPSGQYANPQPPTGQYPPGQPPTGHYPPAQPPTPYPPEQPPPGQHPPEQQPPGQPPTGQYPPAQPPSGQYPPGQQPPGQPPGQYPPPEQPPAPYPPSQPPPEQPPTSQYPPTQPPGQPPTSQYPPTQPPGQPPTGQYPPTQPPGQYPPTQPPGTYPPGQPPTTPPPGYGPGPGQGYGPPTTPAPVDPCDQDRKWGPPKITAECCPPDRSCCGGSTPSECTWDELEDQPCVRATGCTSNWTKLSCTCESSNADCTCEEWDCGGFPDGVCVPCEPCQGLLPEDEDSETGGEEPPREDCNSDSLRRQLEANQKHISSRQAEKAKLDAEIKASQDRDKELAALIGAFDSIVDKYKTERYKLTCREDCLKGFARDAAKILQEQFETDCLDKMGAAINEQLCKLEMAKCCQKNLEWKLEKATRLVLEQREAENAWKKADQAFAIVKDLPKWIADQFTDLDKLKDQIAQALHDKDPLKQRLAFYLFYWKFLPRLCKRFPVAVCCEVAPTTPAPTTPPPPAYGASPTTPTPPPAAGGATAHIGCNPGDWHPSKIDVDVLKKLICCAWETVRAKKQALEDQNAAVEAAKHNLAFIKKQIEDSAKTLEDRIKSRIESVACGAASSR